MQGFSRSDHAGAAHEAARLRKPYDVGVPLDTITIA